MSSGWKERTIRERYSQAAKQLRDSAGQASEGGLPAGCTCDPIGVEQGFHDPGGHYFEEELDLLPGTSEPASLGCGNPTAVAHLREGETVLDLGSGGGLDVLLSARRVGPSGKAYGLDISAEMLRLARENQQRAGVENVEFLAGALERIPLPDSSVDIVISNCVINLSVDKGAAFREMAWVLRPGGRLAITDIVANPALSERERALIADSNACLGGALTAEAFRSLLGAAGFVNVELHETHRVHVHACSAIVRALMPTARGERSESGPVRSRS